jgi:hypothetical protein
MVVKQLPVHERGALPQQERWVRVQKEGKKRFRDTWNGLRRRSAPVGAHIQDHGFSWAAMGCIDAACFVHSTFTGLLVTGVLLFLFELKIGD